ncbi:SPFH domain-containing protein [Acidaminococcus sp.]|uniref:SPFH domain-containing protein n=1 Tax=Acidaminococcus sp. TaxID=1872103 RepID=UPI003D7D01A7
MGLIKAAMGAAGGVLADQWKEFFYCQMAPDILMMKGQKRTSGRSSNTSGEDNIISNGSRIAVNSGQCMIIVESGKIVDFCAEPGEFTYDRSTEPSVFTGDLKENVKNVFQQIGKRFTFGGDTGKDQRVYYFNTKELIGNKYGTPSEIPFKVKDDTTGQVLTVRLRCFGEYSYRIVDPLLFYTNVAGNDYDVYERSILDGQLKSELLMALQPAFARLSAQRIDYTEILAHTFELAEALNEVLSKKWSELRGIEIVSFGINNIKANEADEEKIQKIQMGMTLGSNPNIAMGTMADATSDAMRMAASNESGSGAAFGFMGMNMAGSAGSGMYQTMAAQTQAQQAAQVQAAQTSAADTWDCACGQKGNTGKFCMGCGKQEPVSKPAGNSWDCSCGQKGNTGKFCGACGKPKPETSDGWTCPGCKTVNQGKFCMNCGARKPEDVPLYRCDKCGWQPPDPHHPPKFCPQCGDPFDDSDKI